MKVAVQSVANVRGSRALLATEAFERLAYCGTQLLMLLYLASLFDRRSSPDRVFYSQAVTLFGPQEPIAMATQIVALFLAASQLAALAGAGLIRFLDARVVVALGGILMAAGHFAMAEERFIAPALVLLIVGAGCTISNKLVQFGALLGSRGADRASGYAEYTMAVNVGALLAPVVCGTIAERWGWAWGFRTAGLSMVGGLACYMVAWRWLPAAFTAAAGDRPTVAHAGRRKRILAIGLLLLPYVVALAVVNQAYTLAMLWASTHIARDIGGFTVPITWVLIVDGLGSIVGLIIARRAWRALAERGRPLSDVAKLAIGCALLAAAYAVLSAVATLPLPSLFLFIAFFLVLDLATGWIDAPMEAFTSHHAPGADVGMMMGMVKASGVAAALLLGWLGRWFAPLGPPAFWAMNAALAAAALIGLLILWPIINRLVRPGGPTALAHADALPDLPLAGDAERPRQAGQQEVGID